MVDYQQDQLRTDNVSANAQEFIQVPIAELLLV